MLYSVHQIKSVTIVTILVSVLFLISKASMAQEEIKTKSDDDVVQKLLKWTQNIKSNSARKESAKIDLRPLQASTTESVISGK